MTDASDWVRAASNIPESALLAVDDLEEPEIINEEGSTT